MPRVVPEDRLDQIVDAAAREFGRRGYRRTQMSDVARALRLAPGTLYRYVESKQALLSTCLERAFLAERPPVPPLPLSDGGPERLAAAVRRRLETGTQRLRLREALARERSADPVAEVRSVVEEMYERVAANRDWLQLVERVAADHPDVAQAYLERQRGRMLERLAEWIRSRIAAGQFRPVPDVPTAARAIVECCAWFAWHQHGDLEPGRHADSIACETLVTFATRTLVEGAP